MTVSVSLPRPQLSRAGLPRAVLELCSRLSGAGQRAWIVGGPVRDSLHAQLEQRAPAGQ